MFRDSDLTNLHKLLRNPVSQALGQWQEAVEAGGLSLPALDSIQTQQCIKTFAASRFVSQQFTDNPSLGVQLLAGDELTIARDQQYYYQLLGQLLNTLNSEEELSLALRRFRQRTMCRIIWRDINRFVLMQETVAELSYLAQACVDVVLDWHYQRMCKDIGTPKGRDSGMPQKMVVLGMGKLGAWELNLSSDIDLIFTFPENGQTEGGRRSLANSDFFTRLGQRLIKTLDEITAEGFVFRVDMRLRPYGQSGALALSFGAMEEYYIEQGREWERYAMIKARVIAGDMKAGEQLQMLLKPFVYRRYIDFSAFDSLREMKTMINREVNRRQLHDDVKLGAGGIREIEFIVQAFQLIRGGREPQLQERRLLDVLQQLVEQECLPIKVVSELSVAYVFLRNVEHAIQGLDDKQTQVLPANELDRLRIAMIMGFADWQYFYADLSVHRGNVSTHFADVITPVEEANDLPDVSVWQELWSGESGLELGEKILADNDFEDSAESYRQLVGFRESKKIISLQREGRQRLDLFMPIILAEISKKQQPSVLLSRVLPLVESVQRRTAYLVLLLENVAAREQLLILFEASPWIASQLTKQPVLLDELVNTDTLYAVPERKTLQQDLRQQVLRLEWGDLEGHMEALRYFRAAHVLRIAASEVTGRMPLMKVSDYLTLLAEAILEHVVELCWQNLVAKHGRPINVDGEVCDKDFLVVGYGKLGGIELGYGSDLDLVFIHNGNPSEATDGAKPIAGQMFFNRLGQRIIHVLATATVSGELYEVDMRLRPSGNSGLLVTSLAAFIQYQHKDAWTWEHQALVRARAVAGDENLAEKFALERDQLLAFERNRQQLRDDVKLMRQKMADNLLLAAAQGPKSPIFHLKQGSGGIVDIEFMVQYMVLAWAHEYPSLTMYSDNIRILEMMEQCQLLDSESVQGLMDAYKAYRSIAHRLSLQQQPNEISADEFVRERSVVRKVWGQFFDESS
ncbi:MAG: glutamate-ammonia-ligase adenylyltransferase [Pseudomonadales bacterium]|jgi:glutamate-ammonia-ligase adenylyltransferase